MLSGFGVRFQVDAANSKIVATSNESGKILQAFSISTDGFLRSISVCERSSQLVPKESVVRSDLESSGEAIDSFAVVSGQVEQNSQPALDIRIHASVGCVQPGYGNEGIFGLLMHFL